MRARILGPMAVSDAHGRDLPLGGPRQRSVLGVLLLRRGEVVQVERLVDELWAERAPASAVKTVQVYVSRLRRVLGDGVLATRTSGYELVAERVDLDADEFTALAGEGRRVLAAGDPQRAALLLEQALGLWRGPALADLAHEPFAQTEAARLEEERVAAIEDQLDARLRLGEGAALVAGLESLVSQHPYRERLRSQLMLALYRAGRQADALAAYQLASELLRDELGLDPPRSWQELERLILIRDPALAPDAPPAPSPPMEPSSAAASTRAARLPVPPTSFVGREREAAEVASLVGGGERLVTLTGAGGSGKTRLALRVAHMLAPAFPDGAGFVGFGDVGEPELIVPTIGGALALPDLPGRTPLERLLQWLAGRRLLLVLDNLEQLVAGGEAIGGLLEACPGLTLLLTSRVPLGLAGERQYEVPVLAPPDAIELLAERSRARASPHQIDPQVGGAICERLDRLPLAIELAAARCKSLPPDELLSRLDAALPLLTGGPRDAPRRQRTLRATIDWSYQLLADAPRRLFARLAVFAGGCTPAAAEQVCDARLDDLAALVDGSLLRLERGRYTMLQTLHEYAQERLDESGEAERTRRAHARWLLELLAQATPERPAVPDFARLTPERENFRAALRWSIEAHEVVTMATLAASRAYDVWTPQLSEARQLIDLALRGIAELPGGLRAQVLTAARWFAWRAGDLEEAKHLCTQALAAYRELDDPRGTSIELVGLGVLAAESGDLGRARATLHEAIRLAREHHAGGILTVALDNLADFAIDEGDLEEGRALCEESRAVCEALQIPPHPAVHINLAHIANLQARSEDAVALATAGLNEALVREDRLMATCAAMELAWPLAELGQCERAARLLGATLEFLRYTGVVPQRSDKVCEQATRNAIREQLGDRALERIVDEGRQVPFAQALRAELDASAA